MKSSAGKIQLRGFDDLFQTGGEVDASDERVQEISLSELFPFKNHPFQVRDDEAMQKTAESIARSGVLSPGIVRPRPEGGYEIIAGHRRKRGSELAGRTTMPVLVRKLDDDEAKESFLYSVANGSVHRQPWFYSEQESMVQCVLSSRFSNKIKAQAEKLPLSVLYTY